MSAADLCRRAATKARDLAENASLSPWSENVLGSEGYDVRGAEVAREGSRIPRRPRVARCGFESWETDKANAEHIATWDPATAEAVADFLDAMADVCGRGEGGVPFASYATAIAVQILGDDA